MSNLACVINLMQPTRSQNYFVLKAHKWTKHREPFLLLCKETIATPLVVMSEWTPSSEGPASPHIITHLKSPEENSVVFEVEKAPHDSGHSQVECLSQELGTSVGICFMFQGIGFEILGWGGFHNSRCYCCLLQTACCRHGAHGQVWIWHPKPMCTF